MVKQPTNASKNDYTLMDGIIWMYLHIRVFYMLMRQGNSGVQQKEELLCLMYNVSYIHVRLVCVISLYALAYIVPVSFQMKSKIMSDGKKTSDESKMN